MSTTTRKFFVIWGSILAMIVAVVVVLHVANFLIAALALLPTWMLVVIGVLVVTAIIALVITMAPNDGTGPR